MSAPTDPARAAEPMTHRQTLEALSGLLLVLFVAMLSSTVVSTALPKIIGALNGSQTQYTWVVTATLLTATATTPIWGKLADLFSKKLLIQVAIVVFVAGSVVAGLQPERGPAHRRPRVPGHRRRRPAGARPGRDRRDDPAARARPLQRLPRRRHGAGHGRRAAARRPHRRHVLARLALVLLRRRAGRGHRAARCSRRPCTCRPSGARTSRSTTLGASLIAAGVSVLLIWVSFVDSSFAWLSWQTVRHGRRLGWRCSPWPCGSSPGPPSRWSRSDIVRQRTTALAILAQPRGRHGDVRRRGLPRPVLPDRPRLQPHRGRPAHHPDDGRRAALLDRRRAADHPDRPDQAVHRGRHRSCWSAGSRCSSTIDHDTPLWFVGARPCSCVGIGVGMTHAEPRARRAEHGAAARTSARPAPAVAFFRSLGGTIGVSVLGAVLAHRVTDHITRDLAAAGIPAAGGGWPAT